MNARVRVPSPGPLRLHLVPLEYHVAVSAKLQRTLKQSLQITAFIAT